MPTFYNPFGVGEPRTRPGDPRDPLDAAITAESRVKSDIGRYSESIKTQIDDFLSKEGTGLFERDLGGKLIKGPDEKLVPKQGLHVEDLRRRSQARTGMLRAAFSGELKTGEPTPEARRASAELATVEPGYKLRLERYERMQAELARAQAAEAAATVRLGNLAGVRVGAATVHGGEVLTALDQVNAERAVSGGPPVSLNHLRPPPSTAKPSADVIARLRASRTGVPAGTPPLGTPAAPALDPAEAVQAQAASVGNETVRRMSERLATLSKALNTGATGKKAETIGNERAVLARMAANKQQQLMERGIVDRGLFGDIVAGLYEGTVDTLPMTVARALRGLAGGPKLDGAGVLDRFIAEQEADQAARPVSRAYAEGSGLRRAVYEGGKSVPTSLLPQLLARVTGQVAGSALGTALGGVPGGLLGRLAGQIVAPAAVSYGMFYYAAKDEFLSDVLDMARHINADLTPEEWSQVSENMDALAMEAGATEALPEAVSAAFTGGLFSGKLGAKLASKIPGLGPIITALSKNVVTRVGAKLTAEVGEELATETWTQAWRADVEARAGLREEGISLAQAFAEVGGPTAFAALLQGGAMQLAETLTERGKGKGPATPPPIPGAPGTPPGAPGPVPGAPAPGAPTPGTPGAAAPVPPPGAPPAGAAPTPPTPPITPGVGATPPPAPVFTTQPTPGEPTGKNAPEPAAEAPEPKSFEFKDAQGRTVQVQAPNLPAAVAQLPAGFTVAAAREIEPPAAPSGGVGTAPAPETAPPEKPPAAVSPPVSPTTTPPTPPTDATPTGQEPESDQQQHPGTAPRTPVPEDQGQTREGHRGPAGGGGGARPVAQVEPAPQPVGPGEFGVLPDGRRARVKGDVREDGTLDVEVDGKIETVPAANLRPAVHEKSSTQVNVSPELAKPFVDVAATIADQDVYEDPNEPGEYGRETEPHITALYGIDNSDIEPVRKALEGIGPITATVGEISTFSHEDRPYDVLKFDVDSPDLQRVNQALRENTDFESDFPDYKPHLTIAYVKKGAAGKYTGPQAQLTGKTLTFNSLVFSTQDGQNIEIALRGGAPGSTPVPLRTEKAGSTPAPATTPEAPAPPPIPPPAPPAPTQVDRPKEKFYPASLPWDQKAADDTYAKRRAEGASEDEATSDATAAAMGNLSPEQAAQADRYFGDNYAHGRIQSGDYDWGAKYFEATNRPLEAQRYRDLASTPPASEQYSFTEPDPQKHHTALSLLRDALLGNRAIQNAVASGNEHNALDEIKAQYRKALGRLGLEAPKWTSKTALGETWAQSYENAASLPSRAQAFEGFVRDMRRRAQHAAQPPAAPPKAKAAQFATYEEFRAAYREAFRQAQEHALDKAGSRHWAERMAELADTYPEWAAAAENEKEAQAPAQAPRILPKGQATPAAATRFIAGQSNIKGSDRAGRFLADFTGRMHRMNKETFEQLEIRSLSQAEWDSDSELHTRTPDSAAAYDPRTNILYLNRDQTQGESVIDAFVHEMGHFAEQFALSTDFTQAEWKKLNIQDRIAAKEQYLERKLTAQEVRDFGTGFDDFRSRSEWVAMQFARVVRGQTEQMPQGVRARLEAFLKEVRELVRRWIGDPKLTTRELDALILEKLGYAQRSEPPAASKPAKPPTPAPTATKPAPAPKPEPAPAPKPPAPPPPKAPAIAIDDELDKALDDAFDGLLGTPAVTGQAELPEDKVDAFLKVARVFVAKGVTTPEAVARILDQKFKKTARKYSEAVWDAMGIVKKSLRGSHDWNGIYAQLDAAAITSQSEGGETRTDQPRHGPREDRGAGEGGASPPGGGGGPVSDTGERADRPLLEGVSPEDVSGAGGGGAGGAAGTGNAPVAPGVSTGQGHDQQLSDVQRGDAGGREGQPADGAGGRSGSAVGGSAAAGADVASQPSAPARANYTITDPETLVGGGPKARFAKNRRAIETYLSLKEDNRQPSREQLDTIAAYTGWGAFGQELFQGSWEKPKPRKEWQAEDRWLRDQLGQQEWESLQRSIINAHYTDPITVATMWAMAQKLGFKGGRVLEPGMGIGNFFGLMPAHLAGQSQLTGIELDQLTGGMARMLYPNANIQIKGYQQSKTADNFYDLVIGNWPFANITIADPRYDKLSPSLHNYFFLKALDQVRPGGLVIGITSNSTMDQKSAGVRVALARKAELVGAYRLPAGAFQQYAGTKVVADIIVLKKRAEPLDVPRALAEGWINTVERDTPARETIEVNQYWNAHPQNVLGRLNWGHGTTTGQPGMIVEIPDNYERLLRALPEKLPADVLTPWDPSIKRIAYQANDTKARQRSVIVKGGSFFQVQGEHLAPLHEVTPWKVKDPKLNARRTRQLRGLIDLRDGLASLLYEQSVSSEDLSTKRRALKQHYDAFVAEHGPVVETPMLAVMLRIGDAGARLLAHLERKDEKSGQWVPREILTKDFVRRAVKTENLGIEDAYSVDRYQNVAIDVARIAKLASTTEEKVIENLTRQGQIFQTPVGVWEARDQYLSGNVRQKLREAIDAQQHGVEGMDRNIEALKAVVPKDVPYVAIEAQVGATWIGLDQYKLFIKHLLALNDADMEHVEITMTSRGYRVQFKRDYLTQRSEARVIWGTERIGWRKVIDAALNNGSVKVLSPDKDGNLVFDADESKKANDKVNAIREEFKSWLWSDTIRALELQTNFNEVFNSHITPDYDGSHLQLVGLALDLGTSAFDFRQHQKNAVWRFIVNGRGVAAHEVGTGKTFTMAGLAIEARRLGLFRKPVIFAHNANSGSVAADIQMAYPGAKVLYVDNLSPANRDATLQQIALDEWDAVVLPHSLLDRLALREETMMEQARELIAELEQEAIDAAAEDDINLTVEDMNSGEYVRKLARRGHTAKDLVKQRERIIERIRKQAQRVREDSVFFEDMGIDAIMVDEAHIFKKIPIASRSNLKGLNKAGSGRSILLSMLTDYVKARGGGKGVFLFTGTPITNTINEAYNMMRYVMDDIMSRDQVKRWDDWFNAFAEAVSDVELTGGGTWEPVERLSQFVNVPELARFAAQVFDVVYARHMPEFQPRASPEGRDETGQGRPFKRKVDVVVEMSPEQEAHKRDIEERARQWKQAAGRTKVEWRQTGDPRLPIIYEGEGVKAALDYRLFDPSAPDHPHSKVNAMLARAMEHYREHPTSTQMIFMDRGYYSEVKRSRRRADGTREYYRVPAFNLAEDIVAKLVAQGVPRGEIAVFSWLSKDARLEAAEAMRRGEIRFAIGGTETMGTGINAQTELRAMHHLDAPWMPGELEQRNGRGWRQGNRWNSVYEYRYFTEGSHDGRRWQILLTKDKFIRRFMEAIFKKGEIGLRIIDGDGADLSEGTGEDVGEEAESDVGESFASAVGDPRILQRAKLVKKIETVENRLSQFIGAKNAARQEIQKVREQLARDQGRLATFQRDQDTLQTHKPSPFSIELEGRTHTERQAADLAFEQIAAQMPPKQDAKGRKIGAYAGFDLFVTRPFAGEDVRWRAKASGFDYGFSQGVASLEANLRYIARNIENLQQEIATREQSVANLRQMLETPFPRQAQLDGLRQQLAQIDAEMAASPSPAPSWLRHGAPVGALAVYQGKTYDVGAHRWDEQNWWLLLADPQDDTQPMVAAPYHEVLDGDGNALFEAREFKQPPIRRASRDFTAGEIVLDQQDREWRVLAAPRVQDRIKIVRVQSLGREGIQELRVDRLRRKGDPKPPKGAPVTPNGFKWDQIVRAEGLRGLWRIDQIEAPADGSDNEALWKVALRKPGGRAEEITTANNLRSAEPGEVAMLQKLLPPVAGQQARLPLEVAPVRGSTRSRLRRLSEAMDAQIAEWEKQIEDGHPAQLSKTQTLEIKARTEAIKDRLKKVRKALEAEEKAGLARAHENRDILGTPRVKGSADEEAVGEQTHGTLEDKRSVWRKLTGFGRKTYEYIETELRQKTVDSFHAIRRLEKALLGTALIDASASAYKWARLTTELPSVMESLMLDGPIYYKGGSMIPAAQLGVPPKMVYDDPAKGVHEEYDPQGLFEIFGPIERGGKTQLWEYYAAAVRAGRLLEENKEKNYGWAQDPQTKQWNWSKAEARRQIDIHLALGQKHPEFEGVRRRYVAFQRTVLDMAEAAGVIGKAQRATWEKADYVPFYRIMEETSGAKNDLRGPYKRRGIGNQRSPIRQLRGGVPAVAVFENIYRNIETLVDASYKNIAMRQVAALAQAQNDLITPIPYKAVPFKVTVDEAIEQMKKAGIPTATLTQQELEELLTFWRARAPQGKDVVSVLVGGKARYFRVKDAPLLRSILAMGPRRHGLWMKMLMGPKRALTSLVTLDPAFMLANTIRDSISAWVLADSKIRPGLDAVSGVIKSLRRDKSLVGIMAGGGGSGHYNRLREGEVRKAFARMSASQRKNFLGSIIDTPAKLARLYRNLGRASENANRIAIYEAALRAGASHAEAAFQAKDIMDFGLRGDSRLLNFFFDTVPFLNARVQGLYRLGRGLKNNPARVATHGAVITGGTLALLALNWDDDRYWELQEWDRDMYYHLWLGGQHIRIPKPFEAGQIFSTIPERVFGLLAKDSDLKLFAGRMLNMVRDTFAFNPIPQAFKPLAERAANLNTFTGTPVISVGDQFKPPEEQYSIYTSESMRELARAMPGSAPQWLRSPKTLEHFVRGYFGTLGMQALNGADALTRGLSGYPEPPATKPADFWMVARFAPEDEGRSTKYVGQFYQLHREMQLLVREIEAARASGDAAQAARLMSANTDLQAFKPVADATYQSLQQIRRRQSSIYESTDLSPALKREHLQALGETRNRLARHAVERAPRRPRPLFDPFAEAAAR